MTLPIVEFLEAKIREYDTEIDLRDGTPIKEQLIKPAEFRFANGLYALH